LAFGSTQDDAFISYRYARNLATGHGLVFNPGERVEGYTNFLWTLILAGAVVVGCDPVILAPWLGVMALAGLLLLLAREREVEEGAATPSAAQAGRGKGGVIQWVGLAAGLFLVSGSAVAAESVQGLETPLFALLVTAALLRDSRERASGRSIGNGHSGWLYALAALTRPEGVATFGVAVILRAGAFFSSSRTSAPRADPRAEAAWLARAALPMAAHALFRLAYYGDLVPNTFHAKVGFGSAVLSRGLHYVAEFVASYLPVLLLAAYGIWSERRSPRARLIAAWTVCHLAYVAYVGGDYKPTFRFFAPVIPGLCLMAGVALARWWSRAGEHERGRRAILGAAAGAMVAVYLVAASREARVFTLWRRSVLPTHTAAGRWLGAHYPPTAVLATNNAGVLPYYSNLPTIDMLGLCDAAIARRKMPAAATGLAGHEKGDGAYVLRRDPDIVLFMQARFSSAPLAESEAERMKFGVSESELWDLPEFHRAYKWTSAPLPGFTFNYFERTR
jgi:arabinofuranosyltransferase